MVQLLFISFFFYLLVSCYSIDPDTSSNRNVIEWGSMFGGLSPSKNIDYDCKFNGHPTCCAVLNYMNLTSELRHSSKHNSHNATYHQSCTIKREYLPSAYEMKQFNKSIEISALPTEQQRLAALISFLIDDVPLSIRWLERVHIRSRLAEDSPATEDDEIFLSKFLVTKTCHGRDRLSTSWIEWIEPLTLHARHPFGYAGCECELSPLKQELRNRGVGVNKQSTDYILVQSNKYHPQARSYLLDAGASTFQSSLNWFLCSYHQVLNQYSCQFLAL
jgi:hypothetical protein